MRIVHVIDYFQPKLGYQETFLAREQARLGHEVYVVTSDRYNPIVYSGGAAKSIMGSRKVGDGFFIEEGIKVWRLRTLSELLHGIWVVGLEEKIQELEPDVVVMHGIASLAAIRMARLKRRTGGFKLIYDDHMTYDNSRSPMKMLYPVFKCLFSGLIQQTADALVAILPETRTFMNKKYGISLDRIILIPLGADDELFRFDAAARQEMRNRLNINESDIVFIYTGKVVPSKRLPLLIEAISLLGNHDDVKVLIVGNGSRSYLSRLQQEIQTRDLEGKFIWHGAVPNQELYKIYSAADVAVWPSGASISQREAMACSLPIIIGEGSKVTELIGYTNGLICREEDATDLAQQMEKLFDSELRSEMGRNSRRFVEERLSWKIIARKFIELVSSGSKERK
ncbi:glycosyltransferase family 4 protein [Chloroflexota bacterium]